MRSRLNGRKEGHVGKMERAVRLLRGLRLSPDIISPEEIIFAAWPHAVGKKVAGHTRAARMVRDRLVVEVEDAIWQKQLFCLSKLILKNLVDILGDGQVGDIEFRIVPRRRPPQREEGNAVLPLPADEGEGIGDPVLRHIYIASKRKAAG